MHYDTYSILTGYTSEALEELSTVTAGEESAVLEAL